MDGRVAMITGGEGSLGMAMARLFVAEGAQVGLVGVDKEALAAGVVELGQSASLWHADVTDSGEVRAAVHGVAETHGRLDVLVCNAGISGVVAPVADYPEDVFDQVLAVHVKGSFLACKHAVPVMADGGSIVIVSSVVGLTSDSGVSAYATAKHAQVGLMRTLAKELAPRRIRANTLHPGPIDNEFMHSIEREATGLPGDQAAQAFEEGIPLGRHAAPAEIAKAALYLASDDSTFMTGATLAVDGGMSS